MRRDLILLLAFLQGAYPALAAGAASPSRAGAEAGIARRVERLGIRQDQFGYLVVDESGGTIMAHNPGAAFVPASNNKLLTTTAALDILGEDFAWETSFAISGYVEGETLHGDLVVRGTGDPNISGRFHHGDSLFLFRRYAEILDRLQIRCISGNLLLDDLAFDKEAVHPSWPKRFLGAWFGAESSALSVSDNCIAVSIKAPRRAGRYVEAALLPQTGYMLLQNHCMSTGRRRSRFGIHRHPLANLIYLTGTLRRRSRAPTVWIPVLGATHYFGSLLKETLERSGIRVAGRLVRGAMPPDAAVLDIFRSPLAESLVVTNKRSQNLYAEQILKTIGWKTAGLGSYATGSKAVRAFLRRCTDTEERDNRMADGSGLSSENCVSPETIAALLRAVLETPEGELLRRSLPVGGVDGTLRHRFRNQPFTVRAKTGYLRGVSALSGYLERDGRRLIFSILINADGKTKRTMDGLADAIVRQAARFLPPAPAGA